MRKELRGLKVAHRNKEKDDSSSPFPIRMGRGRDVLIYCTSFMLGTRCSININQLI